MGLLDLFRFEKKTLYYPGCLTKGVLTKQFENYKEIFKRLGINYILLSEEVCCGLPILNAGYRKEVKKIAKKNYDLFKKNKIKKIITSCPACYHTFRSVYPKILKEWDFEVEHTTITILNALKKRGVKSNAIEDAREKVVYHDPCYLGRYSEIYEEPRQIIEILGGNLFEYKYNRQESFCCGAGSGLRENFPDVSKDIAKLKAGYVSEDISKIVSPCGMCYSNIGSITKKSTEFSDFVLAKLKELGV